MHSDVKIPTHGDFFSHSGLNYRQLWEQTPFNWQCPACMRTKYQIMRWTKRTPNNCQPFWGWFAGIVHHHDHGVDFGEVPRFARTLVCHQCNSADGVVKRQLQLPQKFSFSPSEIGEFVIATPHTKHDYDYGRAWAIYEQVGVVSSRFFR